MKSNLLKQLNQIKKKDNSQRNLEKNAIHSLIFDFSTAANFDLDTIYSIAKTGFDSLLKKYPKIFARFEEFFIENKKVIREKFTEEENKEFSLKIIDFLLVLSMFFCDEDSHKILEYLLRNYDVQRYESDYLVLFFLPYHQTYPFIKLLQNIELENSQHFYFIEKNVK